MRTSRTFLLVEQLFRDTPLGDSSRVYIEDIVLYAERYVPLWLMPFPSISYYADKYS